MKENIYDPEFVRGLFNRMSGSYERTNYITSFGFSIRWRKQFLAHFESDPAKLEIIDLLTGMGETWHAVKSRFPNSNLTALDFSKEMLKNARLKDHRGFKNKIALIQEDVLQNTLPSDHYDLVICAFGLKTFDREQLRVLAEQTKRILKKGGRFSFIEVSKPGNKILNALYKFYLGRLVPLFGKILLGDPAEYRMLWKYTKRFKNASEACELFNSVGLRTTYQSYFYSCASGFYGSK